MPLYDTILGDQFREPLDPEGFILWLEESPLTPGERVQLKKDFEASTGFVFPQSDFDRIRGANQPRNP